MSTTPNDINNDLLDGTSVRAPLAPREEVLLPLVSDNADPNGGSTLGQSILAELDSRTPGEADATQAAILASLDSTEAPSIEALDYAFKVQDTLPSFPGANGSERASVSSTTNLLDQGERKRDDEENKTTIETRSADRSSMPLVGAVIPRRRILAGLLSDSLVRGLKRRFRNNNNIKNLIEENLKEGELCLPEKDLTDSNVIDICAYLVKHDYDITSLNFRRIAFTYGIKRGLSAKSLRAIASLLKVNKTITHLDVSNNFLGCFRTLTGTLISSTVGLLDDKVHRLDHQAISRTLWREGFARSMSALLGDALKHNETLRVLNLENNDLGDPVCSNIVAALKINRTLHTLVLAHNIINENTFFALSEVLADPNCAVMHLDIKDPLVGRNTTWRILDTPFFNFATALKTNRRLRHLDISKSGIVSDEAMKALIEVIKRHQNLASLNMSGVYTSGDRIWLDSIISAARSIIKAGDRELYSIQCVDESYRHMVGEQGKQWQKQVLIDNILRPNRPEEKAKRKAHKQGLPSRSGASSERSSVSSATNLLGQGERKRDDEEHKITIETRSADSSSATLVGAVIPHRRTLTGLFSDGLVRSLKRSFRSNDNIKNLIEGNLKEGELCLPEKDLTDKNVIDICAYLVKHDYGITSLNFRRITFSYGIKRGLSSKAGRAIANLLKVNKTITHLDVSNNFLGCFRTLTGTLISSTPQYFDSRATLWNFVGQSVGEILGDALKHNETLRVLNLENNALEDLMCCSIVDALKINRSLHTLVLAHNLMYNKTFFALSEVLADPNCAVMHLDIRDPLVGRWNGNYRLDETQFFNFVSSLKTNRRLRHLDISKSGTISLDAMISLAEVLKVHEGLRSLNMSGIWIGLDRNWTNQSNLCYIISAARSSIEAGDRELYRIQCFDESYRDMDEREAKLWEKQVLINNILRPNRPEVKAKKAAYKKGLLFNLRTGTQYANLLPFDNNVVDNICEYIGELEDNDNAVVISQPTPREEIKYVAERSSIPQSEEQLSETGASSQAEILADIMGDDVFDSSSEAASLPTEYEPMKVVLWQNQSQSRSTEVMLPTAIPSHDPETDSKGMDEDRRLMERTRSSSTTHASTVLVDSPLSLSQSNSSSPSNMGTSSISLSTQANQPAIQGYQLRNIS